MVSGVDQQIKAGLASQASGQLSGEELGITQNNYATGRNNFWQANAGMNALAGIQNPLGFGSEGTQANQSAFGEQSQIEQQQAQKDQEIIGTITGVAADVATGGLSGGMSALMGAGGGDGGQTTEDNSGWG